MRARARGSFLIVLSLPPPISYPLQLGPSPRALHPSVSIPQALPLQCRAVPTSPRAPALVVAAVLTALPAAATTPRSDYPCDDALAKQAATFDAEASKAFGKKLTGTCTCMESDCSYGMHTLEFAVEATPKLAVAVRLERNLGSAPDTLPPSATSAGVSAFAKKLAAHPLVAPLLADANAKCRLSPHGALVSADCDSARWTVGFTEDDARGAKKKDGRTLYKQHHRLPLGALKGDPDFTLAAAHPAVAEFLKGKADVVVEFRNASPRRMLLHVGATPGSPFAPLKGTDVLTVFFETSDNGWAAQTRAVQAVCAGEQHSRCK